MGVQANVAPYFLQSNRNARSEAPTIGATAYVRSGKFLRCRDVDGNLFLHDAEDNSKVAVDVEFEVEMLQLELDVSGVSVGAEIVDDDDDTSGGTNGIEDGGPLVGAEVGLFTGAGARLRATERGTIMRLVIGVLPFQGFEARYCTQ